MNEELRRRGPDSEGVQDWSGATLGHRRLSIFDLSARGGQPMLSDDAAIGVVFNGAIYNYRELRRQLEEEGFAFRSETDTEVLLHGYRAWGLDRLVYRLRGMFAFAIWDERAGSLAVVRDRLGVKPLFFAAGNGELAFASTMRGLRAAGLGGTMDPQAVADYLQWGFVPEDRSIYEGIAKLPPATILRWTNGAFTQTRYWAPPRAGDVPASFEEAVVETERLLLQAVQRRMQADVPISALLSGGIDSALVCWGLRECRAGVRAYTFSAAGHAQDESSSAVQTAHELGIGVDVLETAHGNELYELVEAYDEPFACGSALGMLRLARAVRDSATVLLTGDGGDDVFLGYPEHRYLWSAQRIAQVIPAPVGSFLLQLGHVPPRDGAARAARNYLSYILGGLPALLKVRSAYRHLQEGGYLRHRLTDVAPSSVGMPVHAGGGRSALDDYLAYDLSHQFVSEYLVKVDRATMHHGLEARSPFLDQDLWEFAAGLPYRVRLRNGRPKAVLREIARRRISERVAAGRKRGFEVPVSSWLKQYWSATAGALLSREGTLSEFVDTRALWCAFVSGRVPAGIVWHVTALAAWLEQEEKHASMTQCCTVAANSIASGIVRAAATTAGIS